MARVTVEDALREVSNQNPFALVLIAVKRAIQLMKGAKPTIKNCKNKAGVLALREIEAGNVYHEGDLEDLLRASLAKNSGK